MSALAALGRSALAYAGHLRLHVLPLLPRKKEPDGRLVPHGFRDATTARGAISAWWTVAPQANVGIACAPSGVVVIDVDPRNGGDESLAALEREIGSLPRTWTVLTPSGGAHYYLRHQGSTVAGTLGPGLDVKHQGYVVAPPSVHPNGGVYAWDLGAHPLESAIAPIPVAWLARLTRDRVARPPSSGVDARESFLGRAFEELGWLGEPLPDGRRMARCPWAAAHSDGRGAGRDSSTVLFPRRVGAAMGGFACSHAHCAQRRLEHVLRALRPEAIDVAARAFPDAYRSMIRRLASWEGRSA